ncbi:MAG: NUDIX domain-containing protein [Actinomycetota bacterium]
MSAGLSDRPERWPVVSSEIAHDTGRIVAVRTDVVRSPDGGELRRDVVLHPGAVGVVALDDEDRMLLLSQYRHPTGYRLLEAPAGLLDVEGEPYHETAARELYEEGHVRAADWRVLVDAFTSPGMTNESVRVYLARSLSHVPDDERHVGQEEEADMTIVWARFEDVVEAVLAGRLHNAILCLGVLAAWAARQRGGYGTLRPADAPWDVRA